MVRWEWECNEQHVCVMLVMEMCHRSSLYMRWQFSILCVCAFVWRIWHSHLSGYKYTHNHPSMRMDSVTETENGNKRLKQFIGGPYTQTERKRHTHMGITYGIYNFILFLPFFRYLKQISLYDTFFTNSIPCFGKLPCIRHRARSCGMHFAVSVHAVWLCRKNKRNRTKKKISTKF